MKLDPRMEQWRIRDGEYASVSNVPYGAFRIPGPIGRELVVMADNGADHVTEGWEHVSVSLATRTPNWQEMTFVKGLCWSDDDTIVQFHPRKADHINVHDFCLHMWRPPGTFPTPPKILV